MEESLRRYFLKSGYYVARGVPFSHKGLNITDIDLWLYSHKSSVSREITIVDIKNKKVPQAVERILCIKGLRAATGATNAVVATTDRRQEVKDFGRELGVLVLDGEFLSKVTKSDTDTTTRISDEEFSSAIKQYELNKLDGDWEGRIKQSKSLLAKSLSFDSCNEWLSHGKFFAEQSIINSTQRETSLRCLYLICSFIAVAVDYCMKELFFYDPSERSEIIKNGFTYGSRGNIGMTNVLNIALRLVEEHAGDGAAISKQVRASVEQNLSSLSTGILGEFFAKLDVGRSLFKTAIEFEHMAMRRGFSSHTHSTADLRAMLYCLLDYWGIERVMFNRSP